MPESGLPIRVYKEHDMWLRVPETRFGVSERA
jgi:hypothetical protein